MFISVAPADYNAITTVLTFSPSILRQCVNFTLPDDEIVEGQERFTVIIDSTDNVTLTPDIAVVEIEEGESKSLDILPNLRQMNSYSVNI